MDPKTLSIPTGPDSPDSPDSVDSPDSPDRPDQSAADDAPTPPNPATTTTTPTPPTAPVVVGYNLSKIYGQGEAAVHALRGVDVSFDGGTFSAIMGPSGSGKSTLLHLLAGLEAPSAGVVRLGQTALASLDDNALTVLRRNRIGFVFQSFNLLPMFTAEENILLPLKLAGRRPDADWLASVIDTLAIGDRLQHRPAELSGGGCQRVAIARALVTKPDVIFADEPTGNLDTRSGVEVLAFLRRSVRELGQSVVMVTHDPSAAAYAERVVLLADGLVAGQIDQPTPEAVLAGLDALRALED